MDSIILNDVKNLLGIPADYLEFDNSILMYINSAFAGLYQMGIGSKSSFIANSTTKWSEFTENALAIPFLQTYMYCKVRLIFDPPNNNAYTESIKKVMEENEYRLRTLVDWGGTDAI